MQRKPRLFSHEEATALIPILRPRLQAIQHDKRRLDELQDRLEPMTGTMRTNGHATEAATLEMDILALVDKLREAVGEIQALGIEVKDLDMGLVDFPTQREGRVVYLCWMVDEPQISFWHELDTGFGGREPL